MTIVSLFDMSGHAVRDWAKAGETCFCLDIVNDGRREEFDSNGSITFLPWDASALEAENVVLSLQPDFIFGFPPCTHLAVSGAKHFESKYRADPVFRKESLRFVFMVEKLAKAANCEWMVENPVGVLSTLWRKPDYIFSPFEYGGYLPATDQHPEWPEYIPPRDAYKKPTCIWHGNCVRQPIKSPVPPLGFFDSSGRSFNPQTAKLGGKGKKTKEIRSMTPREFARAFFIANYRLVTGKGLDNVFYM